jgi:hypothetical protein
MSLHGFELRLELLKMAKEMLEQDWHAQREITQSQWEQEVNLAQIKAQAKDSLIDKIPNAPTFKPFPTEEEIIKKAKVLNEFISQKV